MEKIPDSHLESSPDGIRNRWLTFTWRMRYRFVLGMVWGACAFLIIMLISGWPILAFLFGLCTLLALPLIAHITRRKGRLSVFSATVFIPTIVAILCWGWTQLSPYRSRNKAFVTLTDANIGFNGSRSNIQGEWFQDELDVLPVWIVRLAGKHATSKITRIASELEQLQSSEVCSLYLEDLEIIEIHKSKNSPDLSLQSTDWLARCPSLSRVRIDFESFTPADLVAIESLSKQTAHRNFLIDLKIDLDHCDARVDLSSLPRKMQCEVRCQQLIAERAKQLNGILSLKVLTPTTTEQALIQLSRNVALCIAGCNFDRKSATAITGISAQALRLEKCRFPNEFDVALHEQPKLQELSIIDSSIENEFIVEWLSKGKVSRVLLSKPSSAESAHELELQMQSLNVLSEASFDLGNNRYQKIDLVK